MLAAIQMLSPHEIFLRLSFAALLGAVIGIERDVHRRPAGIRTSAFVCMGSALFTILSFELAKMFGDTSATRIASNLVQGIGFLGAGAILREAGGLVGLTTAATIFVEAAIGMAVGGDFTLSEDMRREWCCSGWCAWAGWLEWRT